MIRPKTFLLFSILLIFNVSNVHAQHQPDTLKIFFTGNSYVYYKNTPQLVSVLTAGFAISTIQLAYRQRLKKY